MPRRNRKTRDTRANGAQQGERLRYELARLAARIMAEDGGVNCRQACDKAARSLGVRLTARELPDPREVERQLIEYLDLFQPDERRHWLAGQRQAALRAMQFFSAYSPRLSGPVLSGATTARSTVDLHLFAENEDEIAIRLLNEGIAHRLVQRRFRWADGSVRAVPAYLTEVGNQAFELVVFPLADLAHPPQVSRSGAPVKRASADQLRRLLDESPIDDTVR